ncbi:MAG: CHASE sensor domain-containing protein, partial [Bacteroidales bacterium]|nr:CHASE sensor domain-containing protein [Bacteroidales bacterium]
MNRLWSIKNMSIKNKIITVVLFVTFIAVLVGFVFIAKWDINRVRKNIQESLVVNAQLIGDYCVVPLYFGDRQQAAEALLRLKFLESVESGYLFTEKGELFATYPDSLQDKNLPTVTQIESSMLKDGFFYISEPISFKGKVLGVIYVRANSKLLESQKRILFTIIFILIIILVVMSYLIAAGMQKMISEPILNLARLTASISRNQDFTVQIQPPGRDEVGILYQQFNHLLAQLLKKQNEREEAEKKLKDSEAQFRYLFEQNPAVLMIYELGSLQVLAVNEAFIRHYGYSQQEILSMRLPDIFPVKEQGPVSDLTRRLIGLSYSG